MSAEPFIGEIQIFPYNFAPRDWALCDGHLLPIAQYSTLYAIIGTTYGGNGTTNFALPDLKVRAPIGQGRGPGLTQRRMGESLGSDKAPLSVDQMPSHDHKLWADATKNSGSETNPTNHSLAWAPKLKAGDQSKLHYHSYDSNSVVPMVKDMLALDGKGEAHYNMQPYLVIGFYIALDGVYPPRS